ncbi:hypothetical protein [Gluconobacter morbifer]|uniref:Uncharacterized protein n=1 Tax=Gluconobacter morbifer G707 TaxID=1088869 RepID=G6XFU5_9PROT|nr:hypothetical protein [Gluconobacter morbifer]EHH69053.1 hypothetical protein GMO_03600 [Gluconobacter morbifer G707]
MSVSAYRPLRHMGTRLVETCSMGAWFLLAATPLIVVFCAIHG